MTISRDELKRTLRYDAAVPLAELAADIEVMRAFDRLNEQKSKLWMRVGCSTLVVFAMAALVTLNLADRGPVGSMGVVTGALLVAVVAAFIRMKSFSAGDLPNERYELVGGLAELLAADMADGGEFSVDLAFGPTETSGHGTGGPDTIGLWKVAHFAQQWLQLSGRLLDGTRFRLTVTERVQRRTRWARSASGKTKRKSKAKTRTEFALQLRPKAGKYPHLGRLGDHVQGVVKLPGPVQCKRIESDGRALLLRAQTKVPWTVDSPDGASAHDFDPGGRIDGLAIVGSMFLSLFRVINVAARAGAMARPTDAERADA